MNSADQKFYSVLLFLFVISFAGGTLLFNLSAGSFSVFAFRICIVFIPLLLLLKKDAIRPRSTDKWFILFIITWLIYALISVSWSIRPEYAHKHLVYLASGLLMSFSLLTLHNRMADFDKKFSEFWMTGFFLNAAIACWEMTTGSHFTADVTKKLFELTPEHYAHFQPYTVFGNPNQFAVYLVISLSIFIILRRHINQLMLGLLLAASFFLITQTSSRLAIITAVLLLVYFFIEVFREARLNDSLKKMIRLSGLYILLAAGIFFFNDMVNPSRDTLARMTLEGKVKKEMGSESIRKRLCYNGLHIFRESGGKGAGAGQFEAWVEAGRVPYETEGITNPHSGFIEVMSNYGIAGILLFGGFYLGLFIHCLRRTGKKHLPVISLLIIQLLILSNANSGFVSSYTNWMLMILPVLFIPERQQSLST